MGRGILCIECAGLGHEMLARCPQFASLTGLTFAPLTPVFPAVTCTAQATFRTGQSPMQHQVVCNGHFERSTRRVDFWNQSAGLVRGPRIWDGLRQRGGRAAVLFLQQSLGDSCDIVVSPAPVHRHHGGMIQACHCRPPELEAELVQAIGRKFDLLHYWGPSSSRKSSDWISQATLWVLQRQRPEFLATYLPHLDYCQQKLGPEHPAVSRELQFLGATLRTLLSAARALDYEVLIWGDYGISAARQAVYPNRILRSQGLFSARRVGTAATYPNLYDSRAFAMVDHQVAHLYVPDARDVPAVRALFTACPGVDTVSEPAALGLPAGESGELVLTAAPGAWFAYPWWEQAREAPDYASHVDIHHKIGFDPCELFWQIPFLRTSWDGSLPKGTHGRVDCLAAWAATPGLGAAPGPVDLGQLSRQVRQFLETI
ncbi:MAG: alkaline phosphatase family protein [Oligosphaeraceae bacterium]|nr:alkaline phosphatase family protein [Oligosphaeraceae bacterium]